MLAANLRKSSRKCCFIAAALLIGLCQPVLALPTSVLSNFGQPTSGIYQPLSSLDLVAIPFVTDSQFTRVDGVEINAATLLAPGNIFVQIWDIDAFGQPGRVVGTLSGPTNPSGLSKYTGTINLQPKRSYFVVIGAGNGAGSIGTAIYSIDGNGVDSQPSPIYKIGTDFDGNGSINFVNKCLGSASGSTTSWQCGGLVATRFFPEFRILAEIPTAPPQTYSLTSTPLSLDFGVVPDGSTSVPLTAVIENDGNVAQIIGDVSVGAGFSLTSDNCSRTTLSPSPPGNTCSVTLTFSPSHGGITTNTVIIPTTTPDPRSPYGLPLTGASEMPGVVVTPPSTSTPTGALPVPLRFSFLTAVGLIIIAAFQFRRESRNRS